MLMATLLIMAQRWEQPKCPSTHEWINKVWCIHPGEGNSATKRKGIRTPATTRMTLEDMLLSEISQSPKDKEHYMILRL